jgi:transcription elongation factor Elf1
MEEEQAVDDLVRTVACPNCERPAGVRCWRESEIRGGSCYSCTGRYTAAWIAELVPPIAGYHVSFEEYEELRG